MKIKPLLILVEFVVITVPLAWWWTHGGLEAYQSVFKTLAFPLLQEAGVTHMSAGLVRDRFAGFIPFLALMCVTPGMPLKRRLLGLAVGFFVIFLSHVALTYWSWISFTRDGRSAGSMARYFPALVVTDAVPFVLWAVFANRFLLSLVAKVLPASAVTSGAPGPWGDTAEAPAALPEASGPPKPGDDDD